MTPDAAAPRLDVLRHGIAALLDTLRVLRGSGAAQPGAGHDVERGAMFDLASLTDRLSAFADDQRSDDWDQFWVTPDDVTVLRTRTTQLTAALPALSAATVTRLHALADALDTIAAGHA